VVSEVALRKIGVGLGLTTLLITLVATFLIINSSLPKSRTYPPAQIL
jgi:hypothetical protein